MSKKLIVVDQVSATLIASDTENLIKITVKDLAFPNPQWEFFVPGTNPRDVPASIIASRMKHDFKINVLSIQSMSYPGSTPTAIRRKK